MSAAGTAYHYKAHTGAAPGAWASDPQRACANTDTEAFFPERAGGPSGVVKRAKRICSTCPVLDECLDYAMNTQPHVYGIWGGTTESQRRNLRRKARRDAA